MKRILALLLGLLMLLCACGEAETADPEPSLQTRPLQLAALTLECSAPEGSGGSFPLAAKAFGATLQESLAAEGIEVEQLSISFSRMDAATVDALESGGVSLGVLGLGAALVEEGTLLLALSRNVQEPSLGLVIAGESEYGKQLAWRTKTAKLTAEEWSRARIGAVSSDSVLFAAAQQRLHESAGYPLEQYRGYEDAEQLLAAVARGEVDAAIIRAEDTEEYWALTEGMALCEGGVVLSAAAEELQSDAARQALIRAFLTAAETDEGRALLGEYGCGGFSEVGEEDIKAMRELAMWEETR